MRSILIIGMISTTLLIGGCADDGGYRNNGYHNSGSHEVHLDDLIDMRARYLDQEMADRGFRNAGGFNESGASKTFWYNGDAGQCVKVVTRQGQVAKIKTVNKNKCF